MSDDTPTQRFDQQPEPQPAGGSGPGGESDEPRRRGALVPTLIVVGALLLVGVVVLASLLLTRNNGVHPQAASTDSSNGSGNSPTPVPTPTVTVTVTATPAPVSGGGNNNPPHPNGNNVLITQYTISPLTVNCASNAPANADVLTFHWKSINGGTAYIGVNAIDAKTMGMGWNLPPSGSSNDFPSGYVPFTYPCGAAQEEYTLSIYSPNSNSEQTEDVTVKRQ